MNGYDSLTLIAYSPRLRRILRLAEEQVCYGEGIRHEDFWDELESDQAEENHPD